MDMHNRAWCKTCYSTRTLLASHKTAFQVISKSRINFLSRNKITKSFTRVVSRPHDLGLVFRQTLCVSGCQPNFQGDFWGSLPRRECLFFGLAPLSKPPLLSGTLDFDIFLAPARKRNLVVVLRIVTLQDPHTLQNLCLWLKLSDFLIQ